jgi:predicted aspartyl protease
MKHWIMVLLLLPGVASASAYKCTDQDGGTVYSTTPCEDTPGLVPYVEGEANPAGKLVIHKGADGSYRTPGTVNGSPLTFVIDNAASHTAISGPAAQEAGLQCEKRVRAGHPCAVRVHEIDFGSFEMDNVVVDIVPALPDDVRLGRNALRHLNVREAGGALYLSRK